MLKFFNQKKILHKTMPVQPASNLYFFLGSDLYARQQELNRCLDIWLDPDWREMNLEQFDMSQPVSALIDAWLTPPFWGERRVVVAHFSGDGLNILLDELAQLCQQGLPQTPNYLVIYNDSIDRRKKSAKDLFKLAHLEDFQEVKSWNARKVLGPWIQQYLQQHQKSIDNKAIDELIEACGSDKFVLQQALDKILAYLGTGTQINQPLVHKLIIQTDTDIFLWLDHIAKGQADPAFGSLQTLLLKEPAEKILSTLATLFQKVYHMRWLAAQQYSVDDIAEQMNAKTFKIEKDLEKWRKYKLPQLEKALHQLLDYQRRCHSSHLSAELALEMWLGNLLAMDNG